MLSDVATNVGKLFDKATSRPQNYGYGKNVEPVASGQISLYSTASPNGHGGPDCLWAHISPSLIRDRLKHTHHKDRLYFNGKDRIYRPGLEIELESQDDMHRLLGLLVPLTPTHSPNLSVVGRLIIKTAVFFLKLSRRRYGEKVLEYFSAHDNSFFGSVYVKGGKNFVSLHAHDQERIMQGVVFITQ
jgi:hypothetical protein